MSNWCAKAYYNSDKYIYLKYTGSFLVLWKRLTSRTILKFKCHGVNIGIKGSKSIQFKYIRVVNCEYQSMVSKESRRLSRCVCYACHGIWLMLMIINHGMDSTSTSIAKHGSQLLSESLVVSFHLFLILLLIWSDK